ncbi:site-specific tyrosine recombinase XerD [Streptococcus mutans]|uniref:site-specific tyrosine recombinase XerD n=1 Tax=Streptococcus mutans TaxID=1309 RepID=UPI0002F5280E|nr:site-specific tyrosine recombinase XerD [Streptococcus mutans]MCY7116178.1 site-specific tyrosine recombinase XerD [Streptococcus mutans]MCY7124698.1 site-specific tyrosine recombinase XerD [Streptococcus mutans]QIQ93258.1 site-specific tyrosine recombinase XerD [Streptococcus mutans]QIQ99499.1 site-specific tyrosine recombinase XerD [Streptococcus mutans]QIR01149.1 site-specific tyrosine recombinase XerD [Streptococcus mutans]
MITFISKFLASKSLTLNSQKSYLYDLQQFAEIIGEEVTPNKLKLYEQSLADLKVSAKKRKISAVNQFLFFLYENEVLDRFYKIKNKEKLPLLTPAYQEVDLSVLYRKTEDSKGQLIALLIVELGLSPSEIIQLKWENIALEFQVLTIVNEKVMRVLEIPQLLLPYLEGKHKAVYLFDNKGEAYSRQWLFQKLNYYLASVDLSQMTAQKLREQYIIKEKNKGTAILDLTRKLGLKSPVTLEKYFKN